MAAKDYIKQPFEVAHVLSFIIGELADATLHYDLSFLVGGGSLR